MDESNVESLLIQAARKDSTNDVKKLLKKQVNVNCIDNEEKSPLYYAVINKNFLNVEILLERGANAYLQISTNEILADHVIDTLGSKNTEMNDKEKKILQLFEQKICEDSVRILKECEEMEHTDTRNEIAEKTDDCAIASVKQKIDELLNRLDDRNFAGYKAANTFLLFLETFAFDDDLIKKYEKILKRKFLNNDNNAQKSIKDLRSILLHKSSKIRTPEIIFEIIRSCYVTDNEDAGIDKKIQFFDKLKAFLKGCKNENPAEIVENNISTFFKLQVEDVNTIIDQGQADDPVNKIVYEKFMNLVLKAYKNEIEEDEHWFEFNINIFPCLSIKKKDDNKGRCQLENQILHLRNNFVHSFTQHGYVAFKELIIKLRGKLFEYYYVRKLHARLVTSITCKVNEIEDEINKDFESIQGDFKCDNRLYLSEGESKNLFASKFEKSLFPTFVANDEVDQSLIEDYFTFIPVIEYMNKNVKNKSITYDRNFDNIDEEDEEEDSCDTSNQFLKLDDCSRRRFFEQYVITKGYLDRNDQENYPQEKKRLINDLTDYGVEEESIENIFRYYLEEGNKLSDSVLTIIEKVGKFINYLVSIKTRYNKESKMITVVESFLKDRNDLVIPTDHFELSEEIEENQNIIKLVKSFTTININGIEVDVKATIKMMVKTFYDIFNEYSIEFNVRDLFSREAFLDALIKEEKKLLRENCYKKVEVKKLRLFSLISQLIKIDYMSPFIARLVKQFENEDGGFVETLIDESIIKKLIENLTSIECLNSLSILLSVKFVKYEPYQLLHDYIVEKENNLEIIRQIFDKFDHIKGFTNVLIAGNDVRSNEYIKNIIIPFLEIINENAADQLHYIKNYRNNRFRILLNKKLYDSLTGVAGPDSVSEYLSEIVEKNQENRLKEYNAAYDILLEIDKIKLRFSNQIPACNVLFLNSDILKAEISSVQEKFENSFQLLDSVIDQLDRCKISEHSDINASYKLLTLLIQADVQKLDMNKRFHEGKSQTKISPLYEDLYIKILKYVRHEDTDEMNIENVRETYEKIKDNDNYKMLLSVSELLCSEKYFNILFVASQSAYENVRMHTQLDFKERIKKSHILLKAFEIYESIYSYYYEQGGFKDMKTLESLKYIATTYKEFSLITENVNKKLFYCLKALVRLNLYYDIRKEIPVGFVRNSIKKNIIYALNSYISAYIDVSKSLTISNKVCNQGDALKKVYELCKKILDRPEQSSTAENLSKHYLKILFSIGYICKYLGQYYYSIKKLNNSIDFNNESLKYFEEIMDAQDTERKKKCFKQVAKINNTLFRILTNHFDSRHTIKMNEAAEHLRAAIYFYANDQKVNGVMRDKLKEQLINHCKSHHLNFGKIWNKYK